MTNATKYTPLVSVSHRSILLLMTVGLLCMFGIALKERVENPDLVIQVEPRMSMDAMGAMGAMSDMVAGMGAGAPSEVGMLMQQLADKPHDVAALIQLSEHLVQGQQWTAAETFVRRAIEVNPQDAQAQYLLGVILHGQGKSEEAVQALENAVLLKDEASVRYSLGVLYVYYLENIAKGVEHFTAGLNDATAPENLQTAIRAELEKVTQTNK